jgi:hypothetical protein
MQKEIHNRARDARKPMSRGSGMLLLIVAVAAVLVGIYLLTL